MEHRNMVRANLVSAHKLEKTGCDKDKIQIESVDSSFKDEPVGSQLSQSEASSNELTPSKRSRTKYKKKAKRKSRRRDSSDVSDSDEGSISSNSDELASKKRKKTKSHSKQKVRSKQITGSDSNSMSRSTSRSSSVSDLLSDSSSSHGSASNSSDGKYSRSGDSNNDRSDDDKTYPGSENSDFEHEDDSFDKSSDDKVYRIRKKCAEYEKLVDKLIKQLKLLKKKQKGKESTKEKMRYESNKKKVLRKKKKVEHKLRLYQERISSIRNNKKRQRHVKEKDSRYNFEDYLNQKQISNSSQRSTCENSFQQNYAGSSAGNVKIPYPVLNDSRDQKTILSILKNKQDHLNGMLDQTLNTLKNIENENKSHGDFEARRNRLKNLEENIKVQLTRLTRQIDFINYGLEVSKISKILENPNEDNQQKRRYNNKLKDLNKKVEHLFNFMNDANQRFIRQQEGNKNQYIDEDRMKEKDDKAFSSKLEDQSAYVEKNTKHPVSLDYYRSMPPPVLNKTENETNKLEKNNVPNTFNLNKTNMPTAFDSHKYPISGSNFKTPNDRYSSPQSQVEQGLHNPTSTTSKTITPDSDPKEILAMLNAKYGHKKESNIKKADEITRNKETPSDQQRIYKKNNYNQQQVDRHMHPNNTNINRQNTLNNQSNINQSIESTLLNANLPVSMLNSPTFMSTMTSMLQGMSQQGININAIINQLPHILSSFNNNNSMNTNPTSRNYSNSNLSQARMYNNQQADGALLPNPYEYEPNLSEQNLAESFCNYLSDTFQNMPDGFGAGMNAPQLNAMILDAGMMEDFNCQYNSNNSSNNYNINSNYNKHNNRRPDNNSRKSFNNFKNNSRRSGNSNSSSGYSQGHTSQFRNFNKYKKN